MDGEPCSPRHDDPSNRRRRRTPCSRRSPPRSIHAWPDPELADRLEQRLTAEHRAFSNDIRHASFFVWTLARQRPSIADELCRRVLQDQASILRRPDPSCTRRAPGSPARRRTPTCPRTPAYRKPRVVRNVANPWDGPGACTSLAVGETDLLRSLIRHDDPVAGPNRRRWPHPRPGTSRACRRTSHDSPLRRLGRSPTKSPRLSAPEAICSGTAYPAAMPATLSAS